jgi:hypothetical protein
MFRFRLTGLPCLRVVLLEREAAMRRMCALLVLLACPLLVQAKDVGPGGVMVYPVGSGMGYVLFNNLMVNGKMEMRGCGATPGADKSSYKNFTKIGLGSVKTLERMPDGSLMAEVDAEAAKCVVPGNFKLEKDGLASFSDLVEHTLWTAQVTGSDPAGQTALPMLAVGAKMFFGVSTDVELAEFLRADRVATVAGWKVYLAGNGSGAHSAKAKRSLSGLYVADGRKALDRYTKTREAFGELKTARIRAEDAQVLTPGDDAVASLTTAVRAELVRLDDASASGMKAYRKGLADHGKGYASLVAATKSAAAAVECDPKHGPSIAANTDAAKELAGYETDVKAAQAKVAAQQQDEAFAGIRKYASFAEEDPRVKQVIAAAYQNQMDHGEEFSSSSKWALAVAAYDKAYSYRATDAAKAALVRAHAGMDTSANKAAADAATAKSQEYITAKDYVRAYDELAKLPPAQRVLVRDEMASIMPSYMLSAVDLARRLQQTHTPIKGRGDEDAARQAYGYLEQVDDLIDSPNGKAVVDAMDGPARQSLSDVKVRLDLLSDAISAYYVTVARKFLNKPVGTGVGLGWNYLDEAATYKTDLDVVRDEKARASETYQMRAKLSLGVEFRDQTSTRQSTGFAEQLQDAIATGLETSPLPVHVIRPSAAAAQAQTLVPNYQLIGEILEHRTTKNVTNETMKSNYRSGERDVPNPAWNQADQEYQSATAEVEKARANVRLVAAKNNAKLTAEAQTVVDAAEKKAQDARSKVNMIPQKLQEDVIRPYTYTKQVIAISNIVELSFRIVSNGTTIEEPIHVKHEVPNTFTVLENIKPDDTEGVHNLDVPPSDSQLLTDVEIAARDELVKAALLRVQGLPGKILADARAKVNSDNPDAAAELYIRYLNCTAAKETPERVEAIRFLAETYNLRHGENLSSAAQ